MKLNSATAPNNLQRENEVVILLMCEMYPHRFWHERYVPAAAVKEAEQLSKEGRSNDVNRAMMLN